MIILTIIDIQIPYSLRTISDLGKAVPPKKAAWERLIGFIIYFLQAVSINRNRHSRQRATATNDIVLAFELVLSEQIRTAK